MYFSYNYTTYDAIIQYLIKKSNNECRLLRYSTNKIRVNSMFDIS